LYHAGFRGRIARSTLADANEHRDWRIYADCAHVLIAVAKRLYANDGFAVDLDAAAYAFDSTTIDLCLALFPWARFRRRKGAVKLHTLIDLRGNIPCFIRISDGTMHDVRALDDLLLEPGAFYMMDRGYIDFARLYVFTQQSAFFVIRSKRNMDYSRQPYQAVDKSTGLRSDQRITLQGVKTSRQYPEALRRITYRDAETQKRFAFPTNNWTLPALTIAQSAASGSRLDSYVYVYDANGQLLARNDDSGGSRNSRVDLNVTAGTTYYVKAAAYGRSTGARAPSGFPRNVGDPAVSIVP
jgi:hypothetical protein